MPLDCYTPRVLDWYKPRVLPHQTVLLVVLQDVALTQSWLVALAQGGYRFPDIISEPAGQQQPAHHHHQQQQQQGQETSGSAPNTTAAAATAWAVVFSRSSRPTPAVRKLASLPGWRVVVVADPGSEDQAGSSNSKHAWQLPQLTYLDEQQQSRLPFSVLGHLPWKGGR